MKIQIGLAGDVMIGRLVNSQLAYHDYSYPIGNVLPLLKSTDINIINLETALTNSEQKIPKTFNFKATPDRIKVLELGRVSVVNLANNHLLDFGTAGLTETIETLDKAGIRHVGAGKNALEATGPVIFTVRETRVGVLGFTDNEPTWKANSTPGTNYIDVKDQKDVERALTSIADLRDNVDLLIVTIHWGPNMVERPSTVFREFAHAMIDHGADIIHGHSAHILQGIELYKHKVVFYDTGDFVDDYMVDTQLRNDLSAFFILKADRQQITEIKIVPVCIAQCQVNLAVDNNYDWVIKRLQALSSEFGTVITNTGSIEISNP